MLLGAISASFFFFFLPPLCFANAIIVAFIPLQCVTFRCTDGCFNNASESVMMKSRVPLLVFVALSALCIASSNGIGGWWSTVKYADSSCKTPISIQSTNAPGCQRDPPTICQPSGNLFFTAHCTDTIPDASQWRGSSSILYAGPNCTTDSLIAQAMWWADGVCQPQATSSMIRSCATDRSILKVTNCFDKTCSQNCNTQTWPLSNSTFCQNTGTNSAVRFSCT
jgi:hypothetical protein